jgi:hypothetical protein
VIGRIITPLDSSDSFWVRMDGGTWYQWNNNFPIDAWTWQPVHDAMMGDPAMGVPHPVVVFPLTAGAHTLDIAYREVGAWLDKIVITNDPDLMPTGTGD